MVLSSIVALCLAIIPFSPSAFGASGKSYQQLRSALMCIHHYEGAMNANTGNGYYGGWQMDLTFQRTYGSEFLSAWGTADNWPPSVQLIVAARAVLSGRGYGPWPHTRTLCNV